jgi:vacuolar-type H+-ATPase subunit E/Vma4
LSGLHKAKAEEIKKMKQEFNKQIQIFIKQSKERMTSAIQHHISDIMKSLDMAISRIKNKSNEVADQLRCQLLEIMQNTHTMPNINNATPRCKSQ